MYFFSVISSYSELPSGSERDFSHHQSGSAHLAGDGRCRLVVPYFMYQIIEQHVRFQVHGKPPVSISSITRRLLPSLFYHKES